MNAIVSFILWLLSLVGITGTPVEADQVGQSSTYVSTTDPQGPQIININPRTVTALEDTMFHPNNSDN